MCFDFMFSTIIFEPWQLLDFKESLNKIKIKNKTKQAITSNIKINVVMVINL